MPQVSYNFRVPDGPLSAPWGSVFQFSDSGIASNGGIQINNNAFSPVNSGGESALAAYTGVVFGNDQWAQAQIAAIAPFTSVVNITACTSSAGTSTYTYTLTSGNALLIRQQVYVTGMQNVGNNSPGSGGGFQITALGVGTFSVANASPGANESGSNGTGQSASDSICGVAVRCSSDGRNGYVIQVGTNSGNIGSNGTPTDQRAYCVELWKVVNGIATFIANTNVGGQVMVIPDSAGDVYFLSAVGTLLTVRKNGITLITHSDSSLTSGTPGIGTFSFGGSGEWSNPPVTTVGNSATRWTNFLAGDTQLGFTFIQAKTGGTASGNSGAVAFTSNNTAGNLLLCNIGFGSSETFSSLTDSLGNTWVQIDTIKSAVSGNKTGLFYVASCKGGANTVTLTTTGTASLCFLGVSEYGPGAGNVAVLDTFAFSGPTTSASVSIGPITPAGANELVAALFYVDNLAQTVTATGGATLRYGATTTNTVVLEDILAASAGAQSQTATLGGSSPWLGWAAAFKTAPSAYSIPDDRTFGNFPNHSRLVQGTTTFDVPSVDSRVSVPVDSRAAVPVDSRVALNVPQNSRKTPS